MQTSQFSCLRSVVMTFCVVTFITVSESGCGPSMSNHWKRVYVRARNISAVCI